MIDGRPAGAEWDVVEIGSRPAAETGDVRVRALGERPVEPVREAPELAVPEGPGYGKNESSSGDAAAAAARAGGRRSITQASPLFASWNRLTKEAPTVSLADGFVEVRRPDRVLERLPLPPDIEVRLQEGELSFPELGLRAWLDPDRDAPQKSRWRGTTPLLSLRSKSLDGLLSQALPPASTIRYSDEVKRRIEASFSAQDADRILEDLTRDLRRWIDDDQVTDARIHQIRTEILPAVFDLENLQHIDSISMVFCCDGPEQSSTLNYRGALTLEVTGDRGTRATVMADLASGKIERQLSGRFA